VSESHGASAAGAHLDLDALADVLAGEPEPAHLAGCPRCRARLDELDAELPRVSQALADAPVPEVPDDLPARLLAAIAAERPAAATQADVLPMVSARRRWLPALSAIAASAVLVAGGLLLFQRDDDKQADTAAATAGYAVNDSGTNYTRGGTQLQALLPSLLKGSARRPAPESFGADAGPTATPLSGAGTTTSSQKAGDRALAALPPGDPLAALRTTTGLATCLNSLTDPGVAGIPLALDYATFEGTPALVVVLPTSQADKVDVFVVPPGCARADGNVLYFRRLPKP
jgi:hypothetical protein